MAYLTSLSLTQLLDAFAANEPVPAGGSASALAGAVGASLLMMAATLPRTRSGSPEEAADLVAAAVQLRPIRDSLSALVDRDTDAYASLLAAIRLPKDDPDRQAQRRDAIVRATRLATDVPIEIMREARHGLRLAIRVAGNASRAASADIGVGVELLQAAVRGAGGSVAANLAALKDEEYVGLVSTERQRLADESRVDAERARALL